MFILGASLITHVKRCSHLMKTILLRFGLKKDSVVTIQKRALEKRAVITIYFTANNSEKKERATCNVSSPLLLVELLNCAKVKIHLKLYSEPSRTSTMEFFEKIVNV